MDNLETKDEAAKGFLTNGTNVLFGIPLQTVSLASGM
jgi:hypothetical protein